jgi:hypothetical protein
LLFLDNTLRGIIQRFEDEYPETRINPPTEDLPPATRTSSHSASSIQSLTSSNTLPPSTHSDAPTTATDYPSDSEDEDHSGLLNRRLGPRSRHASDVSLAAKAQAKEEGKVHRIGQEVKRKMVERKGEQVFVEALDDEGLRSEIEREHDLLREKLDVKPREEVYGGGVAG